MKLTGHSELGRSPAFIGQEGNLSSIFHLALPDGHGVLLARACDGDSLAGLHLLFVLQPPGVLAVIVQLHTEGGCVLDEHCGFPRQFFDDVPLKRQNNNNQQIADVKRLWQRWTMQKQDQSTPNQNIIDTMKINSKALSHTQQVTPRIHFGLQREKSKSFLTAALRFPIWQAEPVAGQTQNIHGLAEEQILQLSLPTSAGNSN